MNCAVRCPYPKGALQIHVHPLLSLSDPQFLSLLCGRSLTRLIIPLTMGLSIVRMAVVYRTRLQREKSEFAIGLVPITYEQKTEYLSSSVHSVCEFANSNDV